MAHKDKEYVKKISDMYLKLLVEYTQNSEAYISAFINRPVL